MSRATARDKAILSAKPALSNVTSLPSVGVAAEKVPTGGEMVVKCLEREGVEYVFGLSGGAAMPIFDALVDSKIKLDPRASRAGRHAYGGRICAFDRHGWASRW